MKCQVVAAWLLSLLACLVLESLLVSGVRLTIIHSPALLVVRKRYKFWFYGMAEGSCCCR